MEENFDFVFPTTISNGRGTNDVVFCGKVLISRTEEPDPSHKLKNPLMLSSGSESFKPDSGRTNCLNSGQCNRLDSLRSPPSSGSGMKRFTGLFGILRFPLHMELSEIKQRQCRREPLPLPKLMMDEDGEVVDPGAGKNCWDIVRPMRRGNLLFSALAKFGCIPLV